jgi:superoxide reductase
MGCSVNDLYECSITGEGKCDCVAEMVRGCAGDCKLACCGQEMKQVEFKTADQGREKHVPVIEKIDGGYKVKVGDVPHPMEPDHFIQFIELRTGDEVHRKHLKPGMPPEAVFKTDAVEVCAVEFCNKHGFWIGK